MSEVEEVIIKTRRLEQLLRVQFHAQGYGLHQLISSCEERLPHDVIGQLEYIANIRSQLLYEEMAEFKESSAFSKAYDECMKKLQPRSSKFIWRVAIFLMVAMTLVAFGLYYIYWELLSRHLFQAMG
jgi:hypothetical protein